MSIKQLQTLAIVDEVKAVLRVSSDYAVAKSLGVNRATVSRWRTEKGGMADEVALRAAAITGKAPASYLLRLHAERTSSPGATRVLLEAARRIAVILIALGMVLGVGFTEESRAASVDRSIHYAKLRRRWPVTA